MSKIKDRILTVLKSHHSPREIALGIAIGTFIGVIPLYGLHTWIILLLALIAHRPNKIAMLAASSIYIPPVIPFVVWAEYNIGRLILHSSYPALDFTVLRSIGWRDIRDMYWVLLLGSAAFGLVLAGIAYFISLKIASSIHEKRMKKADG